MNISVTSMLILVVTFFTGLAYAQDEILVDNFENGLSEVWKARSFHNETIYEVVPGNGSHVLQATSNGSASGLVYEHEFDVSEYPVLRWRWKIEDTVEGGDYRQKRSDDFAARIYVTFPHWFFPKTTSLNYIWANLMPRDEIYPNAYTSNAMMIAVESGKAKAGTWIECRRNIVEDYRRAFGEDPPGTAVIAIMTDTDNTGKKARAWYDDIYLMKSEFQAK